MPDYQDPGWSKAWRGMLWFAVPFGYVAWTTRQRWSDDGLTAMRGMLLSMIASLLLFAVAFTFIEPWNDGDVGWIPLAVAAIGLGSLVGVVRVRRLPHAAESPRSLALTYRAKFFIGVGYAMSAAAFSLVGVLITGTLWVCTIGLAFSFFGLTLISPTRGNIARAQDRIRTSGSPLSLGQALVDLGRHSVAGTSNPILVETRVRLVALAGLMAAGLLAYGIQIFRPTFDPRSIVIPALVVFIGVSVATMSLSVARALAGRRRGRPPGPPEPR